MRHYILKPQQVTFRVLSLHTSQKAGRKIKLSLSKHTATSIGLPAPGSSLTAMFKARHGRKEEYFKWHRVGCCEGERRATK